MNYGKTFIKNDFYHFGSDLKPKSKSVVFVYILRLKYAYCLRL